MHHSKSPENNAEIQMALEWFEWALKSAQAGNYHIGVTVDYVPEKSLSMKSEVKLDSSD